MGVLCRYGTFSFPEAGGGEGDKVGVENIKSMITGFGGKANTRFSKKTDYLLVGMDAKAGKFGDAKEKGIDILSLRQLQGILLGHHSFADLKRLPTLSSDQFAGHNYQVIAFALYDSQLSYDPSHFVVL